MNKNIILKTDSYKCIHFLQYPENCKYVYSYFESRNGSKFDNTVFFGLQYILKEHLEGVVVTRKDIEDAANLCKVHFGSEKYFNRKGWEYILNNCGGKLPIRIRAIPEGSVIPTSNVLMTVENTDENCPWLTNHLETVLTHVWYPTTVATLSRETKKIIEKYFDKTSTSDKSAIAFMLHDFGFRGTETVESASIGGAAHLINFMGTDTIVGMLLAMDYYRAPLEGLAYSVPASEHSVMTAFGEDGEEKVLDNLLEKHPTGILSIVSDSYDIKRFVKKYIKERKDIILNRQLNDIGACRFVVRPDSLRSKTDTPEKQMLWLIKELYKIFGGTTNSKGYTVLNPKVGCLWGDGIDKDGIEKILKLTSDNGFSIENFVFGMGGGLLQKVNRDTCRFAFKCSAQKQGDEWFDIQKKPPDKSKASKKGKLKLIKINGEYKTVSIDAGGDDLLETMFDNGEITKQYTLSEIRERAKI